MKFAVSASQRNAAIPDSTPVHLTQVVVAAALIALATRSTERVVRGSLPLLLAVCLLPTRNWECRGTRSRVRVIRSGVWDLQPPVLINDLRRKKQGDLPVLSRSSREI